MKIYYSANQMVVNNYTSLSSSSGTQNSDLYRDSTKASTVNRGSQTDECLSVPEKKPKWSWRSFKSKITWDSVKRIAGNKAVKITVMIALAAVVVAGIAALSIVTFGVGPGMTLASLIVGTALAVLLNRNNWFKSTQKEE